MPGMSLTTIGMALGMFGGAGAGVTEILQDGLVAEYRFDEGSGQVLTDYAENGHDGRLGSTTEVDANDPTWDSEGLTFDGSADYVRVDGAWMSQVDNWTLEVVMRPTNITSTNEGAVMYNGTNVNGYGITINHATGGALKILHNAVARYTTSYTFANTTDWHHVVAVRDGGTTRVYVDAAEVLDTATTAPDTPLTNASFGAEVAGGASRFAPVKIAYGVVRSEPLSAAEVSTEYARLQTILSGRGVSI